MRKIRTRTRPRKLGWKSFILIAVCLALLVSIAILVFGEFELGVKKHVPERFEVRDECGQVMGNLIHQIKSDADCRIRCRGECDVREMDFLNHSFLNKENSCHACECYCN